MANSVVGSRLKVRLWPSAKTSAFRRNGHSIVKMHSISATIISVSVNHGAGRAKGRKAAIRELDQKTIDDEFVAHDILTNCRTYPKDEAPAAYKDFNEVLKSVNLAGLATEVARLKARFVIKDSDDSLKGAA